MKISRLNEYIVYVVSKESEMEGMEIITLTDEINNDFIRPHKMMKITEDNNEAKEYRKLLSERFFSEYPFIEMENYMEKSHFDEFYRDIWCNAMRSNREYGTRYISVKIPRFFMNNILANEFSKAGIYNRNLYSLIHTWSGYVGNDKGVVCEGLRVSTVFAKTHEGFLNDKCHSINLDLFGPFLDHLRKQFPSVIIAEGTERDFIFTYIKKCQQDFFFELCEKLKEKNIFIDIFDPEKELLVSVANNEIMSDFHNKPTIDKLLYEIRRTLSDVIPDPQYCEFYVE